MHLISETIKSVQPSSSRPWQSRIVLGVWAAKYLTLCAHHLPGFPISYIGFSPIVASYFFTVPNISFNMQQSPLMTPWGRMFIRKAQCDGRPVYAWTVNDVSRMRWDIRQGLDGVITDDPKTFVEVRDSWHEGVPDGTGFKVWFDVARINLFAFIHAIMFCFVFGLQSGGKPLVRTKDNGR